jgi:tight adherence protein B
MNDSIFVYFAVFLSVALLVLGVFQYYAKDHATRKKINRRMSLVESVSDRAAVLEILRRERGLGALSSERFQALETLITQSGVRLQDPQFLFSVGGLLCGLTAALAIFKGFHIYTLPLSLGVTLVMLYMWLGRKRAKRIARFSEQLPDVLDIFVRSLKAGHPLPVALGLVGREVADPAGTEFGVAADEVTFGLDLPTAMWNISKRVGAQDFLFVTTSISVHVQSGGNLGEVLGRLSRLMRERFRIQRKVVTLTSEGRMSAIVLTGLPIAIFLVINLISPRYFNDVWDDSAFRKIMGVGIAMLFIGNLVMRRMVNFKF